MIAHGHFQHPRIANLVTLDLKSYVPVVDGSRLLFEPEQGNYFAVKIGRIVIPGRDLHQEMVYIISPA